MRENIEEVSLSIRKISQRARDKEDSIRFDLGQPSFDTPDHIKKVVEERLSERQGYTSHYGIDELREAIAQEERSKIQYGPKGVDLSSENVMVTAGGTEALFAVLISLLSDEDKLLLNDPCWAPYRVMSEVNGNRWEQVKYFEDGSLTEEAKEAIEESDALLVNTPNNPTGEVLSKKESRKIGEFAEDSNTFLISDEVYHRLVYDGEHYSPAAHCKNSVVIGSVSKNHAMTGWRIGWLVAEENKVKNFGKASRVMVACPPKIGQIAAVEALTNDSHVDRMKSTYRERRNLLVDRMRELSWEFKDPQGGIYAFPNVGRNSSDFCLEMLEEGVAMVPGEAFGPSGEVNVRICFGASSKEEIKEGFDILRKKLS